MVIPGQLHLDDVGDDPSERYEGSEKPSRRRQGHEPREYDSAGLGALMHRLDQLDDAPPVRIVHPEADVIPRSRMHGGRPLRMADGKTLSRFLLEGRRR